MSNVYGYDLSAFKELNARKVSSDGSAVLLGARTKVDNTLVALVGYIPPVVNVSINGSGETSISNAFVNVGSNLTISAISTGDALFTGWSGDLIANYTNNPININVSSNINITANFSDDADEDGLLNIEEIAEGTDPRNSDTDADGLSDYTELTTNTNPLNYDMDSDGLSDGDEVLIYGTDLLNPDSDSDGFYDGYEVSIGYNPASSESTPDAVSEIKTAIQVNFNAANGQSYRIEGTPSLSQQWQIQEDNIIGTGGIIKRFYEIGTGSNAFFRAKKN